MRNLFLLLFFFSCACTKTVTTVYHPPKAIVSNWDTLKQDWSFSVGGVDSSFVLNVMDCPELLDTSVLLYSDIKCFIRGFNNYISLFSGKYVLNNIDYGFSRMPFSPDASFRPFTLNIYEGKIFLTLSNIPSPTYSKEVIRLLNLLRKSKGIYFRYILIPGSNIGTARTSQTFSDVNSMDYKTLCKYLNIPE